MLLLRIRIGSVNMIGMKLYNLFIAEKENQLTPNVNPICLSNSHTLLSLGCFWQRLIPFLSTFCWWFVI